MRRPLAHILDPIELLNRFDDFQTLILFYDLAGKLMDTPTTKRFVMNLDHEGRPSTIKSTTCIGTNDPIVDFVGTYTPKK